jgi:hypothetical protein
VEWVNLLATLGVRIGPSSVQETSSVASHHQSKPRASIAQLRSQLGAVFAAFDGKTSKFVTEISLSFRTE